MKALRVLGIAAPLAVMGAGQSASAAPAAPAAADEGAVRKALEDEMQRSLTQLKMGAEAPPYYLRYAVVDSDHTWMAARLGVLVEEDKTPGRSIYSEIRVGSPDEDNTNFVGSSPGGSASVTREDNYAVLRRDLWQLTDHEYKSALESFARKKASKAVQAAEKEKQPDFAKAPPLTLTTNKAVVPSDADIAKLRDMTLKLSAVFKEFPKVDNGRASNSTDLVRRRLLTSEKTWTDERRSRVRIDVHADTIAEDGQHLNASVSFTSSDLAGLPGLDKMEAEVRAMAKNLSDQRTAPQVEAGVASVLFEGQAAGQLARLLLASPFSGQPIPKSPGSSFPTDGSNSFAERVGLVVAPKWLSVLDDPGAVSPLTKKPLAGGYDSDDEGVAAEKVQLIDHGVVKSLLMGRTPRKEFPKSNGHGRGAAGVRAASSNLIVSAQNGLSRAELLAAAQRSAGPKGSVYIVKQLSDLSGIGRGQTIQAKVAVRWKDGKEEPVRGVSLEGFAPKKLKKDLVAAGRDAIVVEEYAQAIVTPSLLFEDVDVGKPNDKNRTPPLYPSPLAVSGK